MNEASPTWVGLAWATLPMLAVMVVLWRQRLGQVGLLSLAATRLTLQITFLGWALGFIFAAESPALLLLVVVVMTAISAYTVGTRRSNATTGRRARGLFARLGFGGGDSAATRTLRLQAFVAIALGASTVMVVAVTLSLGVRPWYDARVVIPLLGMILGNSVNGVALAAERLDSELRAGRELIELRLALGATWRQASLPAARAAISTALTPTINSMMIAGIVSVPGMMTGQILAGADVNLALRYQIMMYLLIAGTVGISTLALMSVRLRRAFTSAHQLRWDQVQSRPDGT